MSISAILAYGGQVTAIGLLIVFTGLFIIIGCIYLMSALFKMGHRAAENRARRKAERAAAAKAEPAPVETPAPVQEVVSAPEQDDLVTDPQLIAVIAAAIAAFDDSGKRLVVRKVRRVPGWKDAARSEQIYHF